MKISIEYLGGDKEEFYGVSIEILPSRNEVAIIHRILDDENDETLIELSTVKEMWVDEN
jgi:hypothetical protein